MGQAFWYWLSLGAVFLAIEILVPGFYSLWLGMAALITGLIVFVVPNLGTGIEIGIFAVMTLVSVLGWRHYLRRYPIKSDQPALNRRGAQYIGQFCILTQAIVNGRGRAQLADGTWSVEGPDAPAGARMKVTGVNGAVLIVEAAPADAA
ncbi:MAG: NfeD family protein [Dongiaceae bacterium]